MAELHHLLADRWSPRSFVGTHTMSEDEVDSLLDAARWAPSAADSQPCRFVVGHRDDETHKRIFANLAPADQRWAGRAAVLIVAARLRFGRTDAALPYADYDLGQAVAHLTVQAMALGLHVRQVVDIDAAGLRADLDLPDDMTPRTVTAVGMVGDPAQLPADLRDREVRLRRRRPLAELLLGRDRARLAEPDPQVGAARGEDRADWFRARLPQFMMIT
ncbi:nitroreductase family protein [Solwaraspora sp. WMMD406]|uniref:nitroreductase family protein n=1 Tax=Solwaraspora sp. WMMD406 TaxID=3016095 RepID=UPI0024173795|nr:nitroreductase family protein [Solwaraspora sp. WMMD406]MDG4768528.1 nitroreductase family protein [Solwaraspora sp. WMMD406]